MPSFRAGIDKDYALFTKKPPKATGVIFAEQDEEDEEHEVWGIGIDADQRRDTRVAKPLA
jgi:hypothetical protein